MSGFLGALLLHLTSVYNFTCWDEPTRRKPGSRELRRLAQNHRTCWGLKWDPKPGLWVLSPVFSHHTKALR